MSAVTAPEFRGAHRQKTRARHGWRALLIASSFLAGISTSSLADPFKPWSDEGPPPLALDRLDGPAIALTDMRGKPVVVHFFATWCAPCIEEMASLTALAARPQVDVAILTVDVGEVDARVRGFFRDRPVRFPILLDRNRAAMKAWGVQSLPTSFILDSALRPAVKVEEPLDWTSPAVIARLTALSRQTNGAPAEPATLKNNTREVIQ